MTSRLANKVAIITGASKGIGKGIATVFTRHGAKLLLIARTASDLEAVQKELGECAKFLVADVTKANDMQKMAEYAIKTYGRIDILCSNAGIYPTTLLRDMTEAQW